MSEAAESGYAFGDSELARERLAIVAETFEPPTRRLLDDLPPRPARYVVDMGCGPGHTTALLRTRFPHAEITGLDASPAMVEEARARVPSASFAVADVTEPLRLPADVVYARLLLGHLPDPARALAHWTAALWAGPVLDADPPACERVLDRVVEHPVRKGRAAAMFRRNAVTWESEVADAADLIERLRALEAADPGEHVVWELRQTAWVRGAA